jgi:hypothetical protein
MSKAGKSWMESSSPMKSSIRSKLLAPLECFLSLTCLRPLTKSTGNISTSPFWAFGFSQSWIKWVLSLTSSAFFSILINGSPSQPFSPSRGIRQGDPLSPFLFILMAEGLGREIKAAITENKIKGLRLHNDDHPCPINNLLMTPCLWPNPLYKKLNPSNKFSLISGKHQDMDLNITKSQIFFFHTPPAIQLHITRILGFQRSSLPSKYLGAPLVSNVLQSSSWEDLITRLNKRLDNWSFRVLNTPGCLVLLKSVLQAMPLYLFWP